jgi:hypothetical protein
MQAGNQMTAGTGQRAARMNSCWLSDILESWPR